MGADEQPGGPSQQSIYARVARTQLRHPWWFVVAAIVIAGVSFPFVKSLRINSDWSALLPESKPSVQDLKRVAGRLGGLNTLTVVVQSKETDAIIRFTKDLVPKIKAWNAPEVRNVDWTVGGFEQFARKHRTLYASLEDLKEVRNALEDRIVYEKAKANPFFIPLDDPPDDPETVIKRLEEKAQKKSASSKRRAGAYFMEKDGHLLAFFLRTDVSGGDVVTGGKLIERVQKEVDALKPTTYAKDLTVKFTGELVNSREEHDAIATELMIATTVTVALILGSIFVLFWRLRSLLLLGLAIVVPTLSTFAFAKLAVHELNSATAFLAGICIGNGINPGIVWLARYFEERRAGFDLEAAVARTHAGTNLGTLSAAVATSLAYGSLIIADFRGFRDFGIISGVSMLMCWFSNMALLPALTVISERMRPLSWANDKASSGTFYGRVVWTAMAKAPAVVATIFASLAVTSIVLVTVAVLSDPLEYNFKNLRSTRNESSEASKLNARVGKIVGKAAQGNAIAVLADRREDITELQGKLEAQGAKERTKTGEPIYGRIRTIEDYIPKDQRAKRPIIAEIRALLLDARRLSSPEQQAHIDENLPPEHIPLITDKDLPEEVARSFTERDGTRGRVLFVESKPGGNIWDGRYLIEWAGAIRQVKLSDGSRPALAGRAPVFADMIAVVVHDGPKAVLASLIMTIILIFFTFGDFRNRFYTLGSLLMGVLLMVGGMAAFKMKINFLNFVAFPIAFGIGVEYPVNTLRRYLEERADGQKSRVEAIRAAVAETGGAVILCSLTAVFGYISLFTSANKALNSFGGAMTLAELSCLSTAVVGIPALILVFAKRDKAAADAAATTDAAQTTTGESA